MLYISQCNCTRALLATREEMGEMVKMVIQDTQETPALLALLEIRVPKEFRVLLEILEVQAPL